MPTIAVNDIEICYESFGPDEAPPALLVMGLGAQMTLWSPGFISELLDRGFRVIRFDNRDVGLSTKSAGDPPDVMALYAQFLAGQPIDAPYTLSTMAADAVGLLDALEIPAAHIVGASMGGMIVQTIAIEHPDRVLSLTSIMSTTGHTEVGQPDPESMLASLTPAPTDRDGAIRQNVETSRVIGGDLFDEALSRSIAAESYDRCFNPAGTAFHLVAVAASGDRTEGLHGLDVPTLVIHGRQDSLVTLSGGEATAAAVPGAELLVFGRMGHDMPSLYWPQMADAIFNIAVRGERIAEMPDLENDPRLDPRVKWALRNVPVTNLRDVDSRETLLEISGHPKAVAMREKSAALYNALDTEAVASSAGLSITVHEFTSAPDGNTVKIRYVRPNGDDVVPCVYYIHGGGMQDGSAFDALYRIWARVLAAEGLAVAMVDFRNAVTASSAPEVQPFPAGLHDCVSGLRWVVDNADTLHIDRAQVIVAGESGGGNLTLATGMKLLREGDIGLIKGLYALCPYIAGQWPQDRFPSSIENEGYLLNLHHNRGAMAYGIEHFEAGDPLAWPSHATETDVTGLPPTFISVNEADPLRDEGIDFYRLLLRAGVAAQCRIVMGTSHGMDVFTPVLPDVSRQTASSIAHFARA